MKKTSARILAGIMAAASIASFSACGGSGETVETTEATTTTAKTEWTGDNIEVTVAAEDKSEVDINGKVLKWMGSYDLNPTNDAPERSSEVAIFEDTYGAKIQWIETTYGERFDNLATQVLGGDPPDIFVFDDRAFPYDISKGMYQPIDSIVDFNDPMWADSKEAAEKFVYNGEHYIAPIGYRFNDYVILMYDKTQIEDLGIDDPYELYLENKWDWDNFLRVMEEFKGGDPDLYGMSGYWAQLFVYTAGEPMVKYENGKFSNNLGSAAIEKAQNVILRMRNEELVNPAPWIDPSAAFTAGDTMFYGMGTWAFQGATQSAPDDTIQVVPFPRNPDSNDYYMCKIPFAHMWVKGSENADCVKIWLETLKLVNTDEKYKQVSKDKFLKNGTGWTSEIYDIVDSYSDDSKFKLMYEYGSGLSADMTGDGGYVRTLYDCIYKGTYETWEQAREEYMNIFDSEIAAYN